MSKSRYSIIVFACAISLTIIFIAIGRASPAEKAGDNPIVLEYARVFALSYSEAEERLTQQNEFTERLNQFNRTASSYITSEIIQAPELGFIIYLQSKDQEPEIRSLFEDWQLKDRISYQEVTISFAELEKMFDSIAQAASAEGIGFDGGVIEQKGKILFYTPQDKALGELIEKDFPQFREFIVIEYIPVLAEPAIQP